MHGMVFAFFQGNRTESQLCQQLRGCYVFNFIFSFFGSEWRGDLHAMFVLILPS